MYILVLFLIGSQDLFSQKKLCVEIQYGGVKKKEYYPDVDSTQCQKYVAEQMNQLFASGYTVAAVDTSYIANDTFKVLIYKGKKYNIGHLKLSNEQSAILEANGIKRMKIEGKSIDSTLIYTLLKTIVVHYANNGYPFAFARLDSVNFERDQMHASLKVQKGKLISFDTIITEGTLIMRKNFFYRLLELKKDENYAQDKIIKAESRLNDLQYANQRTGPLVRFVNDKAVLVLTLDPKPASRFDFLIGVLPQQNSDGSRKWTISGDFTAELNNTFNQGEYSFFQFKRLKPENLELILKSTIPYLAGMPVGSHIDFRLFKNGTQNLDLFFDGGMQYLFGGFNNIKLYASYRTSTLLDVNSIQIKNSGKLPERLDVSYTGLGLGLSLRKLDYRFNPSKGYQVDINVVAGTKKIIPNRLIVDLEGFENSYDTLRLKTLQTDMDISASYFIPVKNWATIKTGATGGFRLNQQPLRINELLRLGGNKLLRGFNEESIFTDMYVFGTLEFRILLDKNSYLSLPFFDAGFTRITENGDTKYDPVFGIGLGLNFRTPAGIFNLSFASGKNQDNPWDFSKMKIHFGYVNLF